MGGVQLGYNNKAVKQLVITVVGILTSCILIGNILILVTFIWSIIDAIDIFTGKIYCDANNVALGE